MSTRTVPSDKNVSMRTVPSDMMITHNIPSALNLGNRTIMMREGNIALELEPERRKTITTTELLDIFRTQGLESDRILFSAE